MLLVNIWEFEAGLCFGKRQVRYGQLQKQQEMLIRAMETCVSQRETITDQAEAQSKVKHSTKSDYQSRKQELKKKIRETQEVSKESGAAGAHTAGVGLVVSSSERSSVCAQTLHRHGGRLGKSLTENPPNPSSGRMVRNAAELEN